jgi:hypothetical protein
MSHFAISHDFETDPETFWKLFFHEPYKLAMYERIGVKERTVLWSKDEGDIRSFSERILPKRDLPEIIKKIVKGDFGYTETSTFYLQKNYGDVKIEPTLMKEKTKITAKYSLIPQGPGKLRRTFEGDITVSIPLVGGRVEKSIIDDVRRSYDVAAEVTKEWLKKGVV